MSDLALLSEDLNGSVQTVKELKDQIKNLRIELEQCEIGSGEFKSTLDELTNAQNKLKNAMKGGTKELTELDGSYDALAKRMSELKKEWRETTDEVKRADLGKEIAELNSNLKEMDASIGNYQRNVGDYASAFDGVTMKIEGGVARFDRFNNVARSVIGSFDLVEGGLKAIGAESEEATALMDTMQGAMMLTNGLASVKEGVVAFNALRTSITVATGAQTALNAVMMANPIGIIVTAVAALTAGTVALVSAISKNREEERKLKEAYENTNTVLEQRNRDHEREIQLLEASGIEKAELLRIEKAWAEQELQITKDRITAKENELEHTKGLRPKKKKLLQEQLDDLKSQLKEQEKAVYDTETRIRVLDAETKRQQIENATEEANHAIAETKRKLREIENAYLEASKTNSEYWLNEYQIRAKRIQEEHDKDVQIFKDALNAKTISQEQFNKEIENLNAITTDKIKKLWAEASEVDSTDPSIVVVDKVKNKATETSKTLDDLGDKVDTFASKLQEKLGINDKQVRGISAGVNLLGTSLTQTSQLLDTLANSQNQNTEEGFEMAKKFNIASAVMQMLNGIVSAWTSAMQLGPIAGPIMGGVLTGFTTTLGMLNINKIKSTTFENPESGLGNTNPKIPNINTSALLGTPVNYTTEVKGATTEETVSQRVYIVESDITDTQKKVKVTQDESVY